MFKSKTLAIIAYGNTATIFHYATDDKIADVSKTGYFTTSTMRENDVVLINAADECAWFAVSKNKKGENILKRMSDKASAAVFDIQPAVDDLTFEEIPNEITAEAINLRIFELTEKINALLTVLRNSELIAKS